MRSYPACWSRETSPSASSRSGVGSNRFPPHRRPLALFSRSSQTWCRGLLSPTQALRGCALGGALERVVDRSLTVLEIFRCCSMDAPACDSADPLPIPELLLTGSSAEWLTSICFTFADMPPMHGAIAEISCPAPRLLMSGPGPLSALDSADIPLCPSEAQLP